MPAIEAVLKKVHKWFRPTAKTKSPPNPPVKIPRVLSPQPPAAQAGASTPGAPINISAHPFVAAFENAAAVAGNPGAAAYMVRMGSILERGFTTTIEQLRIMTARLVQVLSSGKELGPRAAALRR